MTTLLVLAIYYNPLSAVLFGPIANEQGIIYESLPKKVKNSGKFISFHLPKSAEPITIQIIYFYKIAGTKQAHGGMI